MSLASDMQVIDSWTKSQIEIVESQNFHFKSTMLHGMLLRLSLSEEFHISCPVSGFQTKDNGIHGQNTCLNPGLALYFGNYNSSNLHTICAEFSTGFVLISYSDIYCAPYYLKSRFEFHSFIHL